ncbi:MAG TPA: aminotransferase class V-fold PLP-dependent enzyme [Chloroflexi bacterium]|nr:aminotransferase class V-fold PLP-dependent enzyme [Chloroflexota bacterium]
MHNLRDDFQLDPDVVYLNHGSFGATPRPVFAVYQEWQRRLERQPVRFFQEEAAPALRAARTTLAAYVGARPEDLVFVHNATFGVNVVARALDLQPGDEVLTTTHEYGACSNAWETVCAARGARYVRQPFAWPVQDETQLVEEIWQGVNPRTKVLYFSHITSPTALTLPVAALCRRARAAGILTVIDGAHAPGQIDIDLAALGADIYTGNLHKWLCAPKGAGFLWVRPELQPQITPLVVSWGYGPERAHFEENDFVSAHQWQGTDDISAYLSVPAAIEFQAEHHWSAVRQQCHALLSETLARLTAITGEASPYPSSAPHLFQQMAVAPLPAQTDAPALKQQLYHAHRIEIPCFAWQGQPLLRISVQGYNTAHDLAHLVAAVESEMARQTPGM